MAFFIFKFLWTLNREILKLAIPNILSNISVPLLSMVDMMLMGHLENKAFILAISLGVMIFNFIYWGFGFLRMGTTGFTAQSYGEENKQEQLLMLSRGLAVSLISALFILLLQYPVLKLSLLLIDAKPEVQHLISDYYSIRIFAAPATISLYVFTGWFLGMQNARFPMAIAIFINLLNILLNFILVRHYHMDIRGVAFGTLIAQYSGLLLATGFFFIRYKKLLMFWNTKNFFDLEILKRFFSVNADIIVRTVLLIFTFSFFKIQSGQLDEALGAANLILLEFMLFFAYGVDGFAFAAEAISGKYFGKGNKKELKRAVKKSFAWGMGIAFAFSLVFFLNGENILRVITDQQAVIEAAKPFLWWIVLAPLINTPAFIWDGVYIGTTASRAMRNSMLFATFLFFLPAYYFFNDLIGNHALWMAMTLFMLGRGLLQSILAPKAIFNRL